jgi:NADH:ubiquinone oxidoreductase subunit E
MGQGDLTDRETTALATALQAHRPGPGRPPNILRALLAVQDVLGHVPATALPSIAEALKVPESQVVGVLSYYPDLHAAPRGRHVVRVCLGEACVANRSRALLDDLQRFLGIGIGETTKDGRTTLERVYCLGNCGVGPTVMVDETIHGRMSSSALLSILSSSRS